MHMLETEKTSLDLNLLRSRVRRVDKNPTEAQKEQGNYRKAHVSWNGLAIAIENPKGSKRRGVGEDGEPWEQEVKHHYGYFKGSEDNDGDAVDVFINEKYLHSELVFVINQTKADGRFDEHKCVIGTASEKEARETYLSNYQRGWANFSDIVAMPLPVFKEWLKNPHNKSKPAKLQLKQNAITYRITCEQCDTPHVQTRNMGPKDLVLAAGLCEDCAAQRAIVIQRRQMVVIKSAKDRSPIVAVDLDGTIAENIKPYDPAKVGDPRPGAKDWLHKFREAGAVIVIFTVRGNKELVQKWLDDNSMPYDFINYSPYQPDGASDKIMADVYWDDRAINAEDTESGQKVLEKLQRG